jgi:hypothetical protein
MRARSALTVVMAGALLSLGAVTAHAGNPFTIVVDDDTVTVEQTFTVNGTNACPNSPYTVTFSYTNEDGDPDTVSEEGTTTAEGTFEQDIVVPENAEPESDVDPSVQASVQCTAQTTQPPNGVNVNKTTGGGTASNTITMHIVVATGVLSTNKTSGKAGTVVHVSGTNCLGDNVNVFFFKDANTGFLVDVTLNAQANTFAGDYTIPNASPGQWFFGAFCTGTDYDDRPFTLLATPGVTPTASPSPLPTPATPVVGPVRFTG